MNNSDLLNASILTLSVTVCAEMLRSGEWELSLEDSLWHLEYIVGGKSKIFVPEEVAKEIIALTQVKARLKVYEWKD